MTLWANPSRFRSISSSSRTRRTFSPASRLSLSASSLAVPSFAARERYRISYPAKLFWSSSTRSQARRRSACCAASSFSAAALCSVRRAMPAASWDRRMVISVREDSLVTERTRISDRRSASAAASLDSSSIRPEKESWLSKSPESSCSSARRPFSFSAAAVSLAAMAAFLAAMSRRMPSPPSSDWASWALRRPIVSLLWKISLRRSPASLSQRAASSSNRRASCRTSSIRTVRR